MGGPGPWTCTVSCQNTVLNGEYIEITSLAQSNQDSFYERKASNKQVPAKIKSSLVVGTVPLMSHIEITSITSSWKLYYKTEPPADKKNLTFICGTMFTLTDPDKSTGGTVIVTGCTMGDSFDGTYTQVQSDEDDDGSVVHRYTRTIGTSSLNKIPSYVTCNWARKSFGIEIPAYTFTVGLCTRAHRTVGDKTITTLTATAIGGVAAKAVLEVVHTPAAPCKYYVPFGIVTPGSSTSSGLTFSCYAGSMRSASETTMRSATCKAGRLGTFEPCKPGPAQKYIIVSDFKGSLVPFNGSYVYDESSGQPGKPVTWKNTKASASTSIVASDTESDILELRDTSSSVNYCIKIIPGPPVSLSFHKTTPTSTSPLTPTTDFKAEFSAVPDPCELWSTCIGTNSDKPSKCATEASLCSKAPKASTASTVSLHIGTPPVVVAMSPLVAGDPHLYGTTADALFVVVPLDDKKAKVLRIPNDTTKASAVKDAARSTTGWTVEPFSTVTNPTPPATETTTEPACSDLVECATNATTLSFSSCAAKAVACEPKRLTSLVHTDSLTHGDEKGIKLYQLTSDVLYGTDAVNAYVVLVRKEKVLVAPRDNKTDAAVLDVAKEGTVWTSKRDNTMMWIIIGSVLGGIAFIVLVVLLLRYSYTDQGYDYDPSYADAVPRPRPRIRRPLLDIESGVATTTTPATTAAAAAQGPKPR